MLTLAELQDELRCYTHTRGWTLSVEQDPFEGVVFWAIVDVPDARTQEMTQLRIRSLVPPIPSVDYWALWLWWRLDVIYRHECREEFQRGGKPVFDPHAEPIGPQSLNVGSLT